MRTTTIICDRCGLSIEPLDPAFDRQRVAGGGSLASLGRTSGGVGHNQVPYDGWDFHYLCFCVVVSAIVATLKVDPSAE